MMSPRVEVPLGSCTDADLGTDVFCQTQGHQQTTVNGIVAYVNATIVTTVGTGTGTGSASDGAPHLWKLLVGHQIPLATWSGPKVVIQ